MSRNKNRKKGKTLTFFAVFTAFCYVSGGACAENDLSNERPLVGGMEIERYWKVNCIEAQKESVFLMKTLDSSPPNENLLRRSKTVVETLVKCGHIYNTLENHRFIRCPNYKKAAACLRKIGTGASHMAKPCGESFSQLFSCSKESK